MGSKYDIIGNKSPIKRFHIKPKPVIFNLKNGPSSPKKMKFNNFKNDAKTNGVNNTASIQEQRKKLPVYEKRKQLLNLIMRHETLIVMGETGSGKTTQIPQYIYSARIQGNARIAVTQPRRVAAVSIAMRVSKELGESSVGETVGYTVRFEDASSKQTKIKYLTDGILLREAIADRMLSEYNVVILDEAHERTIHTDVLFGIVKEAQKLRKEKELASLKVILMSATMDVDHFSVYFNNCQAVYLEGRTFPVNVFYTKVPHEDYQTACVATFFKIHREAPPNHDVLIFLTGQEEIDAVYQQITVLSKDPDVEGPDLKVYRLYASQAGTQQMSVFTPTPENTRKVIISTNIAETSITISGIKYVIDSGMVKVRKFHPVSGLDLLKVQRISQEQAWQRTGRAGRESEGYCYRIYTKSQFELMSKTTIPEIQRANLASVAIQLLSLGIHAVKFDFMDKPPKESVKSAFELLKLLGAVETIEDTALTPHGKKMAQFPLDPRYSKMLLTAQTYGCVEEILSIVAMLSGESIYINVPDKREQIGIARQKFRSGYGDHVTLLNIFREYNSISQSARRSWCHQHYLILRNMVLAREIRTQLQEICSRCEIPMSSCGSDMEQVRKCLLTGLFTNVAELQRDRQYVTLDKRQTVMIHPSSVLHGQQPPFVLFTEMVETSKCYMRSLSTVEGEWLYEIVPDYVRKHKIRDDTF